MKKLVLLLTVISLFSCHTNEKFKILSEDLKIIDHDQSNFKKVIIIPNEGCTGCISNATAFIKENIDSLKSNVIFTGIQDFKVLKFKIGNKVLNSKKVYFDRENKFMQKEIASIYPQMVLLDDDNGIIQFKDFDESYFQTGKKNGAR